jgi:hypothetical protein
MSEMTIRQRQATESLNIEGQAALKLVYSALREYLTSFIELYGVPLTAKGKNWFEKYKKHFLDVYGIDFEKAPIPLEELEEVNLARNDSEHSGQPFGMTRRQSKEHALRFPDGLFVEDTDRDMARASPSHRPGRIVVTDAGLAEAIRRVESFCKFINEQR